MKYEKKVDNDGAFDYNTIDFDGFQNYCIIFPEGNRQAEECAKLIRDYCKCSLKTEILIASDTKCETEKEILVGKTNRSNYSDCLKVADLEVVYTNNKIQFLAGHDVTLKSAVEKFLRLKPTNKKIFTFKLETDFEAVVLDGYEYVWGDEFEGDDIDLTKWDFEARMGGNRNVVLSWEKDIINVEDGRLKLHAIVYNDPENSDVQYKVPYSVVTKYKMNYKYGYAEIRARIPFFKGAWPSFWGLSLVGQGGSHCDEGLAYDPKLASEVPYGTEVDVFEVFGSESIVSPNVHKWYRVENESYQKAKAVGIETHTMLEDIPKDYDWANTNADLDNLSNEYHLYGFEWNEKEMSFYIDRKRYFTLDIVNSYDAFDDMSVFHMPIFLMFNNHVFAKDAWYMNLVEDDRLLPFCYYIDWLRVYQKRNDENCELYIDDTPRKYEGR